ncbi:hypothetical protein LWI29_027575 [Acer saccharum]|uniref:GDSL esterase/lipase n=1 Tax=Acer saccharum TaxID=4024 RepID=A0AA39TWD4_ACESA|nr:hypothetical protein LWI29_027575 [Acer saccharum]
MNGRIVRERLIFVEVANTGIPENGEQLGAESILPYLSPQLTGQKLLVGANFASAGIGILNDTGVQFINIIRMFRQFEYFQEYQNRVTALIGAQQTKQLVNKALILITVGGNDFVHNYYLVPFSARSRQYSLPDYVKFVVSEYKKLLMRLYDLGARRVLVTGTGPWDVFRQNWPKGAETGSAQLNCQELPPCLIPNLSRC